MKNTVASWSNVDSPDDGAYYPRGLGRDVAPIPCHSHNDYLREVPLYEALAVGCSGVEADVWLTDNDLLVGHTKDSITPDRSLHSLYIEPLVSIITHQNQLNSSSQGAVKGIFETSPDTSLTLLIDIKSSGTDTLPIILQHLEPLRSQSWLTHFDGTKVVPGPITVVGTGNTPFDLLVSNKTYRDMFFDAPLDQLDDSKYDSTNSYYASVPFDKAIGKVSHGTLSAQQVDTVGTQVGSAIAGGLKARYWKTPSKPTTERDYVWDTLEKGHVGMLNVDDLDAVSRRAW